MIYIKDKRLDDYSVEISVDGVLDIESIPILEKVYERYRSEGKSIRMSLQNLLYADREGRDFLSRIREDGVVIADSNIWNW